MSVSKMFEVIGIGGAAGFVIGAGMLICTGFYDDVDVSMPIDGCYQRMTGSKHSVYQENMCQFTDPRTNEKVEINYHPLAYRTMDQYPVGKKFIVTTESMDKKSLSKKGAISMMGGIALMIIGLIGSIACQSSREDQRW